MNSLPDCRFRKEVGQPNRWRCNCDKLAIPRMFVSSADCQVCPVANGLVAFDANPRSLESLNRHISTSLNSDNVSGGGSHLNVISPVSAEVATNWPRHLIYHIYPFRGSVWRENVSELKRRIALFTGKRIISVALDDKTETRDVVTAELANLTEDVRWFENNRQLGETATQLPALQEVINLPGITFYAHAKGVSHSDTSVVFGIWTRKMYTLLDRFDEVCQRLTKRAFCGLVRSTGQAMAEGRYQWFYPGSFYWFRNDVVAQREVSVELLNRFFPEQFPSHVVRFTESAALYSEIMHGNPYREETWHKITAPAYGQAPQTLGTVGGNSVQVMPTPLPLQEEHKANFPALRLNRRRSSKKLSANSRDFSELGYVILRNVFTADEIASFRQEALAHREHSGDLLSHPALSQLVIDNRLIQAAREIDVTPIRYFGDSSVSFSVGPFGFHRDNADRDDPRAPDWQSDDYPLIRMAIYLQDYSTHGGGLEVMPRSHLRCEGPFEPPVYLASGLGDVVIWNLRLFHTGHGGQHLPFHSAERVALFSTYARPGASTDRYIEYLKTRKYQVDLWQKSHYRHELLVEGGRRGLLIRDMRRDIQGVPGLGEKIDYVPLPYLA
ncbi:MAG: hypothetical protein ACKVT0_05740 [Planctomycetaceae bacterium]